MKKLLVVVDMQNDFVSGSLASPEAEKVVPAVKKLILRKRAEGATVVFTKDTHGENYINTREGRLLPVPHTMKGTAGWEIVPELLSEATEIFEKGTFGSLNLAEYARDWGFEEITLCGVCTDICVASNAVLLRAYCPESDVRVVAAACAGTSPANHEAALQTMRSCQIIIE